jgi:hypothetical protein
MWLGSTYIDSLIIILDTTLKGRVGYKLLPFNPWRIHPYTSCIILVRSQGQCVSFELDTDLSHLQVTEHDSTVSHSVSYSLYQLCYTGSHIRVIQITKVGLAYFWWHFSLWTKPSNRATMDFLLLLWPIILLLLLFSIVELLLEYGGKM